LDIAIWRSSELEGTVLGKRSFDDENFLKEINHMHDYQYRLYIFSPYDKETKICPTENENYYINSKVIKYGFH
jgi:hypothetical protein